MQRSSSAYKGSQSRSSSAYDHPLGQRILLKADNILMKGKKYTSENYKKPGSSKRVTSSVKITSNKQNQKISFTSLLKKHHRTSQAWKRRTSQHQNLEYATKPAIPSKFPSQQSLDDSFKDLDSHLSDEVEREVPIQTQTIQKPSNPSQELFPEFPPEPKEPAESRIIPL